MKKKYLVFLIIFAFVFGVALSAPEANGKAYALSSVQNGNIAIPEESEYSGLLLTADEDSSWDIGTIDLTGITPEKPLFSLLPWVGRNGAFTYLDFTVTLESGGKTVRIKSWSRGTEESNYNGEYGLSVAADGQVFAAHNWYDGKVTPVENGTDAAVGAIPFKRNGETVNRNYALSDGTVKNSSALPMEPVNVYLGTDDGNFTFYLDKMVDNVKNGKIGFDFVDIDNNPETEDIDAYRYLLRNVTDGATDVAWTPWTAEEMKNVNVSFSLNGVTAETKMLFTGFYSDVINAEVLYSGLVGYEYNIPRPYVLSAANHEITPEDCFYSIYKGEDLTSAPYVDATRYSSDASFTPEEEGVYSLLYEADFNPEDGKDELTGKVVTVEVFADLPDAQIVLADDELGKKTVYVGEDIQLGGYVENDAQKPKQNLNVNVSGPGLPDGGQDYLNIGKDLIFKPGSEGKYTLTYSTKDLLLREVESKIEVTVSRSYVYFNDGIEKSMFYPLGEAVPTPSLKDLIIYDIFEKGEISASSGSIKISCPDGSTVEDVSTVRFDEEGMYQIYYSAKYSSVENPFVFYTAEAERRIYVFSQQFPKLEMNALPLNVRLKQGAQITDDIVKVKALVGKEIIFRYGFFSSEEDMVVELIKSGDGTVTDITEAFKRGEYVFTPEEKGVYVISASVDNGYYKTMRSIEIEVKPAWYEVVNVPEREVTVGSVLNNLKPEIVDFYGNKVDSSQISAKVYFNYQKAGEEGMTTDSIGLYEIRYSFVDLTLRESISGSYYITVNDTEKPEITLNGKTETARVGDFVKLAEAVVTDKSGLNINSVVKVMKDGQEVDVYNGGFDAEEKGTYEIIYSATDIAGNQQIISYNIEVSAVSKGLVIGLSVGGGVLVLLIAALVTLIVLRKKGVIGRAGNKPENE